MEFLFFSASLQGAESDIGTWETKMEFYKKKGNSDFFPHQILCTMRVCYLYGQKIADEAFSFYCICWYYDSSLSLSQKET